jgi:hypothetical protein
LTDTRVAQVYVKTRNYAVVLGHDEPVAAPAPSSSSKRTSNDGDDASDGDEDTAAARDAPEWAELDRRAARAPRKRRPAAAAAP